MRKFTLGDSVTVTKGDEGKKGTILECEVDDPDGKSEGAEFYRVGFEDDSEEVISASNLDRADTPPKS